eukprot:g3740.t1
MASRLESVVLGWCRMKSGTTSHHSGAGLMKRRGGVGGDFVGSEGGGQHGRKEERLVLVAITYHPVALVQIFSDTSKLRRAVHDFYALERKTYGGKESLYEWQDILLADPSALLYKIRFDNFVSIEKLHRNENQKKRREKSNAFQVTFMNTLPSTLNAGGGADRSTLNAGGVQSTYNAGTQNSMVDYCSFELHTRTPSQTRAWISAIERAFSSFQRGLIRLHNIGIHFYEDETDHIFRGMQDVGIGSRTTVETIGTLALTTQEQDEFHHKQMNRKHKYSSSSSHRMSHHGGVSHHSVSRHIVSRESILFDLHPKRQQRTQIIPLGWAMKDKETTFGVTWLPRYFQLKIICEATDTRTSTKQHERNNNVGRRKKRKIARKILQWWDKDPTVKTSAKLVKHGRLATLQKISQEGILEKNNKNRQKRIPCGDKETCFDHGCLDRNGNSQNECFDGDFEFNHQTGMLQALPGVGLDPSERFVVRLHDRQPTSKRINNDEGNSASAVAAKHYRDGGAQKMGEIALDEFVPNAFAPSAHRWKREFDTHQDDVGKGRDSTDTSGDGFWSLDWWTKYRSRSRYDSRPRTQKGLLVSKKSVIEQKNEEKYSRYCLESIGFPLVSIDKGSIMSSNWNPLNWIPSGEKTRRGNHDYYLNGKQVVKEPNKRRYLHICPTDIFPDIAVQKGYTPESLNQVISKFIRRNDFLNSIGRGLGLVGSSLERKRGSESLRSSQQRHQRPEKNNERKINLKTLYKIVDQLSEQDINAIRYSELDLEHTRKRWSHFISRRDYCAEEL